MSAKLLVLTLGIVVILSGTAYFTIHGAGSSPAVAERQAEVTVEPPATGAFSGLARSRDGHLLATVNDHKTIELWDDRSGQSLRVLETSDKEWTYSPTFHPMALCWSPPAARRSRAVFIFSSGTQPRGAAG